MTMIKTIILISFIITKIQTQYLFHRPPQQLNSHLLEELCLFRDALMFSTLLTIQCPKVQNIRPKNTLFRLSTTRSSKENRLSLIWKAQVNFTSRGKKQLQKIYHVIKLSSIFIQVSVQSFTFQMIRKLGIS